MTRARFLLALVLFSGCATSTPRPLSIPLTLLDDRLPLVAVRVNGSRSLTFIVDTGASSGTFLNRDLLGEIGLREESMTSEANPGGSVDVGTVRGTTLQIGSLTLRNETLLTAPLSQFAPLLGRPVDGILGHNVLSRYAVRFDYVRQRMVLNDTDRTGTRLPLITEKDMPSIDVTLKQHGRDTSARVEIDTGSFEVLGLNGRYAEKTNLFDSRDRKLEERGVAFGGETHGYRARLDAVQIGRFSLSGAAISITSDAGGYESPGDLAGVLGAEALRRFDLLIDYPGKAVYIRPNRRFQDPWIEDVTGIRLAAQPPDFRRKSISEVWAGSPAAEAGLRPGDEIRTIDGVPVEAMPLVDVMHRLRELKTSRLTIVRDGTVIDVTLHARSLI